MKCCGFFCCCCFFVLGFVCVCVCVCVCVHTLDLGKAFSFWGLCSLPPTRVVAWFVPWKKALKNSKEYHIPKNAIGGKKASKKGNFAHIGNEIKICNPNKCHHHLSNVCENSFRMFHSSWVISDNHSFVWQFVRFSQGNSNCQTHLFTVALYFVAMIRAE